MSNHMLIVEPDVESQRECPPPPRKKLKYQGLTTREIIDLNPKHHFQDEDQEEDSPKRKCGDKQYDLKDLDADVKKKLKF